ncbi:MAG: efflux RND transporter permease subunit [Phycisphaerales bacterium]
MNIAEVSIRHRTVTIVMTLVIIGMGMVSYEKLGRLEDPEFTIKAAQIFTRYPGATAAEVAAEVTDEIETAVQQLGQLDRVTSISEAGLSTVNVTIKDKYDKKTLPQVWDELRRKVNDAQSKLPPGTSVSLVNDDFGDVYGVFGTVYGDGYSYAELNNYVKFLRRELLLVEGVGKVTIFGARKEVVYVEFSRARFAQLGLSPDLIYASLSGQNLVAPAGRVEVGRLHLRIHPTGEFASVEDIGDLLILQDDATDTKLYLKDIATISRGYAEPPTRIVHFNGQKAIGLGISTVEGGNVVKMGEALRKRARELEAQRPIGMEFGIVSDQPGAVKSSISNFLISLAEALAIVIGVLVFAMGARSAILIGVILLLTVLSTFILMQMKGVLLERISLGALIIALGMLVDNAIVVVEGTLINLQRGLERVEAAVRIVKQTMWPLFGATVVAVLAFAAIGVSQDSTGEFCRSLFQVILFSLMMSWVLAITVTPLLGVMFLKVKAPSGGANADPYGGLIFITYRKFLLLCVRRRWATVGALIVMLAGSIYGFSFVEQSFFPKSTRPQYMIHIWLPQGTHIEQTATILDDIEQHVLGLEGVTNAATIVGGGALRFLLTYAPEEANSAYALMLVDVEDYRLIDGLMPQVATYVEENFPDVQAFSRRFVMGPGDPAKIHARLRGPDPDVLRRLADAVTEIMRDEPNARDITNDWRDRVPLIRPVVAETQARNAGITRSEVTGAMQAAFEGKEIGVYREGDDLLPIVARSPEHERNDVRNIRDLQIWSPVAGKTIPIEQVIARFETSSENAIIRHRNRLPTLTVKCDPREGQASDLFEVLRPKIETKFNELVEKWQTPGYTLEWGGEYEDSGRAQAALAGKLPLVGLLMLLVVVTLFNSIRLPLVIFLTVPLAIIGVTVGLLVMNQPFGFMALLGFLSLVGMLIKNAIVLIDEINVLRSEGKEPFDAVIEAGVSRMRPVSMAAMTTVLGMIPLLVDAFFVSMAVTIMFGLTFATVLTLVVVPVLYACLFGIREGAAVTEPTA